MLRLLTNIYGLPVIVQASGTPLGNVERAIFDADKGKVMAYSIRGSKKLLSTVDVLNYFDDGILVGDPDALQEPQELPRIAKLLQNNTVLIGLKAVTERGERLGKVQDVLIDSSGHFLAKLYIKPGLMKRFMTEQLIISRDQVVKITPAEAVVRYDVKAQPAGAEPEVAP
jgi:uncharacterized protein YrrD